MSMFNKCLVYGTKNPAKLAVMQRNLAPIGLTLIGLSELEQEGILLPEVEENGSTPLENARLKALAYYNVIKRPLFSADSGLYFEGIDTLFPEHLQPGVHVRRRLLSDGTTIEMSDSAMTDYYASLAETYGTHLPGLPDPSMKVIKAYYYNAVCFIYDETHRFEQMTRDLSGEEFYLCNRPHPLTQKGFPLDRLSISPKTMDYYYNAEDGNLDVADDLALADGHRQFFSSALQSLQ